EQHTEEVGAHLGIGTVVHETRACLQVESATGVRVDVRGCAACREHRAHVTARARPSIQLRSDEQTRTQRGAEANGGRWTRVAVGAADRAVHAYPAAAESGSEPR